jgi:hypothetical protein
MWVCVAHVTRGYVYIYGLGRVRRVRLCKIMGGLARLWVACKNMSLCKDLSLTPKSEAYTKKSYVRPDSPYHGPHPPPPFCGLP